jgi:uncharacterized protein YecE (DUF72 family)
LIVSIHYHFMRVSGTLRIGTSGWNYPTGRGTWNGVFYPASRRRPRGFDELSFYAAHFDTVEVNSTFYGQPKASVCQGWAERTPPGFEFSVKLYQKFTHPRMYEERVARSMPAEIADAAGARDTQEWLEAITKPNQADLDEFRRGIEPLAAAGKLGALLAQFPPSFKCTPESRAYVQALLEALAGHRVAVELRHRSWSDQIGSTLELLNEFHAAWVQIDEPKFKFSIRQNYLPNVRGFYYMRLHGRNTAQWWRHAKTEDRYDYLYTGDELKEFSETADAARRLVKKLYLYTNNHFSAKSVANAAMIKQQLGEPVDGDYSEEFVERYPEVRGIVRPSRASVSTPGRTSG